MRTYIQSLGADVWDVVEEEYRIPPTLINKDQKLDFSCHAKAMHDLLVGLPETKLVKVMDRTSAKAILGKMRNFYEGDNKVKKAKLQCFRI